METILKKNWISRFIQAVDVMKKLFEFSTDGKMPITPPVYKI
jgi:hypothetical protein